MKVYERFILRILAELETGHHLTSREIWAILETRLTGIKRKKFNRAMQNLREDKLVDVTELNQIHFCYHISSKGEIRLESCELECILS